MKDRGTTVFWLVIIVAFALVFWLLGPVPEEFRGVRGR